MVPDVQRIAARSPGAASAHPGSPPPRSKSRQALQPAGAGPSATRGIAVSLRAMPSAIAATNADSATIRAGVIRRKTFASCPPVKPGLTGQKHAPSRRHASHRTIISGRLVDTMATRSPRLTPLAASPPARACDQSAAWA